MDAKGWARCDSPRKMLNESKGKVSDRRLRLFACALARLRWHKMEPGDRAMVLNVEGYLDGVSGAQEPAGEEDPGLGRGPGLLAHACTFRDAFESASTALPSLRVKKEKLLGILRCLFGNPFRPLVVQPAWLAWGDGTIPNLARSIAQTRDHSRLPILADALEDAGCAHEDLLAHLRSGEKHQANCWALESILNAAGAPLPRLIVAPEEPRGHPDWPRAATQRERPCPRCGAAGPRSIHLLLAGRRKAEHIFIRCALCEHIDWVTTQQGLGDPDAARIEAIQLAAGPCPECDGPRRAFRSRAGRAFLKCTDSACASFEWADCGTSHMPKVDVYHED